MKLKHYSLWALALAFAAVSCSDDLENSGKGNQPGENEQKAYLAVKIATGTKGVSTKAYDGNGENGDDPDLLPEIVGLKEDKVYDINIFLFGKENGENPETGGLAAINRTNAQYTQVVGHGYLDQIDKIPSGGSEPGHDQVTVTIKLDDTFSATESKDYWVLAIVNHGSKITPTSLDALRNLTSDKAWTGGTTGISNYDKFVMSTHIMKGQINPASLVTISPENKSPDKPAETVVYVERLAARVDLKMNGTMTDNNRTDGSFKVTRYLPINLWTGKTNMFKQVSPSVTTITTPLPAASTPYNNEYRWLGDEIWDANTNKYNYVLSVDMTDKTENNYNAFTTKYKNFFYKENVSETNLPYDTNSPEWKNTDALASATYKSGEYTPIFYTCENTMSAPEQRNGYTTGLIFESQFTFGENIKVSSYSEGKIVEAALPESNNGTFYVASHNAKVNFDGIQAIAAMGFKELAEAAEGESYKVTQELLKGFMEGEWPTTTPELSQIKAIVPYMGEKNGVERSFKAYLQKVLDEAATDATFTTVKDKLTYDKFIESETALQIPTGGINDEYIATLYNDYGVSCYREGKSYHKYWIQHDPSAASEARTDQVLGVMEYGIVRNNVYQLNVTGVRDLGDPLPYTPGKDDPDTPDEKEDEYTIEVRIYVKDWILRKNLDIIL